MKSEVSSTPGTVKIASYVTLKLEPTCAKEVLPYRWLGASVF